MTPRDAGAPRCLGKSTVRGEADRAGLARGELRRLAVNQLGRNDREGVDAGAAVSPLICDLDGRVKAHGADVHVGRHRCVGRHRTGDGGARAADLTGDDRERGRCAAARVSVAVRPREGALVAGPRDNPAQRVLDGLRVVEADRSRRDDRRTGARVVQRVKVVAGTDLQLQIDRPDARTARAGEGSDVALAFARFRAAVLLLARTGREHRRDHKTDTDDSNATPKEHIRHGKARTSQFCATLLAPSNYREKKRNVETLPSETRNAAFGNRLVLIARDAAAAPAKARFACHDPGGVI